MTDVYQPATARLADLEAPRARMDWRGAIAAFVVLATLAAANFVGREAPTLVNLVGTSGLVAAASLVAGRLIGALRVHWGWGVLLGPVAAVAGIFVLAVLAFLFFAGMAALT